MFVPLDFSRRAIAVAIAASACLAVHAANAPVTVAIDATGNRHAISANVYGVAFAPNAATLKDLGAPLNRYGGNTSSSYNWKANASNHAADWYFESILEDTGASAGAMADAFVTTSKAGNAQALLTVPMLDWVAKVASGGAKLASFSQKKYGAQSDADWQWFPDAGNGVLASTGKDVVGNDPNDASTPNSVALQQAWLAHLIGRWGNSSGTGVKYYALDNEHSIWQGTHRDVHPVGPTMDEIGAKMLAYGHMIRAADAGAVIFGPEEWGWSGYLLSGYDQQYGATYGWDKHPDKDKHGGMDYMPWLLQHLAQDQKATGKRSLDVFTLHYYPQGGEFSDDVSTPMQLLRNRSTRSLWDPAYVDQSWISDKVNLINRMKGWVAQYYPGTKIGITEYNWGAEGYINGATTQADIDGILGWMGVDYATRWTTPDAGTPTYKAMKMYRNYDGKASGFGDTSVSASVPNRDQLSAWAAVRSKDGALTVMVISKVLSGNTTVTLNLAHFAAGKSAQEWQLTSANAIKQLGNVTVASNRAVVTVPAQSISLLVIPKG
ncbi:MAG: cellulase [Proteobacteria bacterium]|nr:cellulase [Pseudomonadota bacterium]